MKIPRSRNLEEIVATNFQNKPRDKSCIKLSGRKNFRTCSKFSWAIQATFVSSAAPIVACSFHLDLVNQKSNKVHCTGRSTAKITIVGKTTRLCLPNVHVHRRESEISSSKRRADVDGDSIGKTGSMGTSGRTSIMVPPLEAACYRYKKGECRGQRNEWSNIRLLLYSGSVTTSHIRDNSTDYFPTGLQFANLLQKRIKYGRTALRAFSRHMQPTRYHVHLSSPCFSCYVFFLLSIDDARWPFCVTRANESMSSRDKREMSVRDDAYESKDCVVFFFNLHALRISSKFLCSDMADCFIRSLFLAESGA